MSHVRDRWTAPGPNGRRVRTERWGRGKRWQARWIEHGVDRQQAFATKDGAEAHLLRVATGQPAVRPSVTVAAFAAEWLSHQLHYAPATRRAVRMRLDKTIIPELGHKGLREVTRGDVQRLLTQMAAGYAPSTVRMAHSFLTSLFAAAVEDHLIDGSPCAQVHIPGRTRQAVVPLTVAQVAEIADRVPAHYRSMVIVAAATGLRGAELRGLTWDRVSAGSIRVDRQMLDIIEGRPLYGPPKSDAGVRVVPLGQVAAGALVAHEGAYGHGVHGLIWTTRQHHPVSRWRAAEIWQLATKGMAVRPRSGWHDLRHHHASLLIQAGMSPRAVADRLGHSDPAETLRTYAHLWPSDSAALTAVVDAALAGLGGPSGTVTYLSERRS
jgi:integrase